MRWRCLLFGVVLVFGDAATAPAAVTESDFPPGTVRDLIAICAPEPSDPMMTAAVNFCHGFVEGAVIVEEAHEAQRGARKLFCLPTPPAPEGVRADQLYRLGERGARTAQYAGNRRCIHLSCRTVSLLR